MLNLIRHLEQAHAREQQTVTSIKIFILLNYYNFCFELKSTGSYNELLVSIKLILNKQAEKPTTRICLDKFTTKIYILLIILHCNWVFALIENK